MEIMKKLGKVFAASAAILLAIGGVGQAPNSSDNRPDPNPPTDLLPPGHDDITTTRYLGHDDTLPQEKTLTIVSLDHEQATALSDYLKSYGFSSKVSTTHSTTTQNVKPTFNLNINFTTLSAVIAASWLLKSRHKENTTTTIRVTENENGRTVEKTVTSNIRTSEVPKKEILEHLTTIFDDVKPKELEDAYDRVTA
jgi:hypothetical protein